MDFRTDILSLKDKLFRMALSITMQREEAEDVVQEVMMKLWNQRDRWQQIENIEAYAITLTRNQALDHTRSAASKVVSLDAEPNTITERTVNPYEHIYAKENLRRIGALMAQLPEKQRTCMRLRDFEGKNYREIAEILSITEEQVKISIYRARKFMKEHFSFID